MNILFKIAWRNIVRHKAKSLIIGVILFIGAFLMAAGNGIISGMEKGLQKNIVNSFTGDIVIVSEKQESDNVFLSMMGKAIEPINNYKEIRAVLEKQEFIRDFLPLGNNSVMVLNEEGGTPDFVTVIGADFNRYRSTFPNTMHAIEGSLLADNEKALLFPEGARKRFYDQMDIWFIAENDSVHTGNLSKDAEKQRHRLTTKNDIVFMGFNNGNTASDIRLPVKGIIKYNSLNTIWGHFAFMDIESYRQCLGYFTAADKSDTIPESKKMLLSMDNSNIDALFATDSLVVTTTLSRKSDAEAVKRSTKVPETQTVDIESGTYNVIAVLLKDNIRLDQALQTLNQTLKDGGYKARAVSWKNAIGMIGSMAGLIKVALLVFVLFLFFVAIIIIMNTLSMAAMERTSEIGMMRAVGARKNFISNMFIVETGILSFLFGGLGIVVGVAAINIISMLHITTSNDMVQLLYGGDTFNPVLSVGGIIVAVVLLGFATILAVLYPLKLARGITPLDAVSRD